MKSTQFILKIKKRVTLVLAVLFLFPPSLLAKTNQTIKKAQQLVLFKQRNEAIQLLSDELQQKNLNNTDRLKLMGQLKRISEMFMTEFAMLKYNYASTVQYSEPLMAISALKQALEKEPNNQKIKILLVQNYLREKKCDLAKEIIDSLVLQNPHNKQLTFLRLVTLVCAAEYEEFERQVKSYKKINHIEHLRALVALKLKQKEKYAELIKILNKKRSKSPLLFVLKWNKNEMNDNTKQDLLKYLNICNLQKDKSVLNNYFYSCDFITQAKELNVNKNQGSAYEE